ncbi:DUF1800 domain-containing protein [Aureibaculum sp. 2210JD6-5]|uniref:DUF1800 domain-containing protein n=1 Tax=Aureibaculum sp. 2210JD6-5 TaxID=3103957 RepID=UPI002AACFEA0|nr:DUF1800 domain-containing protein [Aureibaculum sp. 2210JD6-5]MDY7396811.1 DUF1800 domain-containing protein [Aureibaculum sp. 2210JD6-5]
MDKSVLWSLRLGFSSKQASVIKAKGLDNFLKASFDSKVNENIPSFLDDDPKTLNEIKAYRKEYRHASTPDDKKMLRKKVQNTNDLKLWWIGKMKKDEYPLREKMVCFWHNHFVATGQKVKMNYWIYQHHMILQKNAFGNFKELTKQIVKSNAMVRYLDNTENKKGKINENLSRELLELFTLGIGNYTEEDIKNGAKALAGLGLGDKSAKYRKNLEPHEVITYLGNSGYHKADDLIDIIFEQKNIPFLLTKKILQWFIYDNPSDELVQYYGNYFREVDFEIKPLLQYIFLEEYKKDKAGHKIKDPLIFAMQILHELQLHEIDSEFINFFLKQQGMDLFEQPNVKGWVGGASWLTSQTYLQRNKIVDLVCNGTSLTKRGFKKSDKNTMDKIAGMQPKINISPRATDNKKIIIELSDRLLFSVGPSMAEDMEKILKYDFDPKSENAENAILRLFNYIAKTPEFQLI